MFQLTSLMIASLCLLSACGGGGRGGTGVAVNPRGADLVPFEKKGSQITEFTIKEKND